MSSQTPEIVDRTNRKDPHLLGAPGLELRFGVRGNNRKISPLQDARNYDMELFPDFGLRFPSIFRRRRSSPAQRILRSCWAGEGLWAYQEGQMGQKMGCFEALRGTRSRQDESIEVGEVGSKRPSLGCNGVHVVRWIGLIFRLLVGSSSASADPRPCVPLGWKYQAAS
jgi:hypothetical protein